MTIYGTYRYPGYYIEADLGGRWFEYLLWPYGVYGFRTADSLERAAND